MTCNRPKAFLQAISTRSIFLFAFLFAACFCVRTIWLQTDGEAFLQDPDAYQALAQGLASSGTLGRIAPDGSISATAYRPPGYIWCISLFVVDGELHKGAVAAFHVFLGTATCLLVARIACILTSSWLVSFIAAIGTAVDPILLKQSALIMTETLATFIAMSLWWIWIEVVSRTQTKWLPTCWLPESWVSAGWMLASQMFVIGVLAGLGCLVRPTNLVWCVAWLAIGIVVVVLRKWNQRDLSNANVAPLAARHLLLMLLGICAVLFPWALRNKQVVGKWTTTTTHGGYTLLLANNPILFESIRRNGWDREWNESLFHQLWDRRRYEDPRDPGYWTRTEEDLAGQSSSGTLTIRYGSRDEHAEVIDDRLATEVALMTISNSPGVFLESCLMRLGWFWAIVPYRSNAGGKTVLAIGAWYVLLYCIAFAGLVVTVVKVFRNRPSLIRWMEWLPALTLVISLLLIHSVFWSNIRMRAPLMPVLYVLAGVFTQKLFAKRN